MTPTLPTLFEANSVLPDFNSMATENNWRDLIVDDRTNSNIFFDVNIQPLKEHLNSNMTDNDNQIVFDSEANHIIAVHGSRYTLLKNSDAFDSVNEAVNTLAENGVLNMDGAFIKDAVVNKGGKVIRQYFFPAHMVQIGSGDKVILRLVVVNSYDGSCNFQVQAGGFRIVCTNGMITGEKFLSLDVRHTGTMDFAQVTRQVTTAVSSFENMGDYWSKLINSPLNRKDADKIITDMSTVGRELSMSKFDMFERLYTDHKKTLGENHWAMYNSLTAWATHYKVNESNISNIDNVRLDREKSIQNLMRKPAIWNPVVNKTAQFLL